MKENEFMQLLLSLIALGLMIFKDITLGECVIIIILAGIYSRQMRVEEKIRRLGNKEVNHDE